MAMGEPERKPRATRDVVSTVSFVVPNLKNDMHDRSVATGDAWLQQHLDGYAQWARPTTAC